MQRARRTVPNFLLTKVRSLVVLFFVLILFFGGIFSYTRADERARVYAATSSNLNFQARLYSNSGSTVPDGYYNLEFKLYDVQSGGSELWSESYTGGSKVRVVNGYFSVNLGAVDSLADEVINWDQEHWLTMNVGGMGSPVWDGEMSPRLKLTAVPFAFRAAQLSKTDGANTSILDFLNPTGNRTINLPDASGTVCLQGSPDCVDVTTTNDTAMTSNNSGLEISADGLRLLGGCADGQLLTWNETSKVWQCTTSGSAVPSFGTVNAPSGTDPVADAPGGTVNFAITGTNITILGDSATDTLTFDLSETALAGDGLAANGSALDVSVGNGLEIVSDMVRINQDYGFTWTNSQIWNLAETEGLSVNSAVSGTNDSTAQTIAITNSSSSGTQRGLLINNAASTGTTDALVVLDNSDTDTVVTSAIQVLNTSRFTNLFDIAGTLISVSEFTVLDGGITEGEISGAITDVTAGSGLTGGGASGNVTLNIGQGTGITVAGDDISVNYGATSNSAVRGDTTLICPSGGGDLSGGGNTITLGNGGTCSAITISESPVFDTSVTTPLLQSASGTLTLNAAISGGADDIIFQTAGTERLRLLENGTLVFGAGANNANLYLSANDTLKTDDLFVAGSGLTVLANGATITGDVSIDGLIYDPNSNLVLNDTVDIGSAANGLRVNTDGSILDINGDIILDDQIALGSASTGLQITTDGVITDLDDSSIVFSEGITLNTGSINVVAGTIQTNSVDRIENDGDLVNIGNLTAAAALIIANTGSGSDITINSIDQIIINSGGTIELQDDTNITGNLDVSGAINAGGGNAFQVNTSGDIISVFTALDGTSTANGGSGLGTSTSLTLNNAGNFDVGNYVQMNSANCGGTGINPCYAKITAKATNTLTITPALRWTNGSTVNEYHVPELGGTDLTQTLANRYGRGYFIAGVATGNGTTFYNEDSIETSLTSFNLLNENVTTLNIGGAATTLNIGSAATTVSVLGSLQTAASETITAGGGIIVSNGGAVISGGIDNNSGGLSEVGVVTGVNGLTFTGGGLDVNGGGITNAGAVAGVSTINASGLLTSVGLTAGSGLIQGTGGLTISGAASFDGSLSDPTGNLALDDIVDIGSVSMGLQVAVDGSLLDIDGLLVLNDTVAIGSLANGLQVTTDGVITDLNDATITFGEGIIVNSGGIAVTGNSTVTGTLVTYSTGYNVFSADASLSTYGYFRSVNTNDTTGRFELGAYDLTGASQGSRDLVLNPLGGNVGIGGDLTPNGLFSVGSTSQFQVDSLGAIIAVGVNAGAGLIQGTGGLTAVGTISLDGAISDPNSNLVLDDTVDIGSAGNGLRVGTDGSLLDIDGLLVLSDTLALGSLANGLQIDSAGVITDLNDATITFGEGITVTAGGINNTGGIDNNNGNITEAGNITGVGTNITALAGLTIANAGSGNDIAITSQDQLTLTSGTNGLSLVSSGSTNTSFTDGTNTLAQIFDAGTYGVLKLEPKATTGADAANCDAADDVGKIYVNSTDKSVVACTAVGVWEQLDNERMSQTANAANYAVTTTDAVVDSVVITASISSNDVWIHYNASTTLNCTGLGCTQPTVVVTVVRGSTCGTNVLQTKTFTGALTAAPLNMNFVDTSPGTGPTTYSICADRTAGSGTITNNIFNRGMSARESDISGADYAELYYAHREIEPGTVLAIDTSLNGGVKATTQQYEKGLFGVVSTNPGQVLSDGSDSGIPVIVGLAGRVPVNVTDEGGEIEAGDYLTSSSTTGKAMKATQPGNVIGKALSGVSRDNQSNAFVLMIVGSGWYGGESNQFSLPDGLNQSTMTTLDFKRNLLAAINPNIADIPILSEQQIDELIHGKLEGIDYTGRFEEIETRLDEIEKKQAVVTQPIDPNSLQIGDLTVSKLATFKDKVQFENDIKINGNTVIAGKTDVENMTVNMNLITEGSFEVMGNATFKEAVVFEKGVVFNGQINVLSYGNVQGLTVNLDLIVRGSLQVDGPATFKEAIRFEKDAEFQGNVSVKGQTTFSEDTAGYATIKAGESLLAVKFKTPKTVKPVVSITLGDGKFVQYSYQNVTPEGFEIVLEAPANEDLTFSWVAIQTQQTTGGL